MQRKTYTLSEKAVKILEDLARKTRLKMSTIVEAGILSCLLRIVDDLYGCCVITFISSCVYLRSLIFISS